MFGDHAVPLTNFPGEGTKPPFDASKYVTGELASVHTAKSQTEEE